MPTVSGSTGADTLQGGPSDDVLSGRDGADDLRGGGGSDTLVGGNGVDILTGGAGHDQITSGDGADLILIALGDSAASAGAVDVITDWSSSDRLVFANFLTDAPATAANYMEASAGGFASAKFIADAAIAGGVTNFVAVAIGSDVLVFADSANDNGGADDAVLLTGVTLADIGVGNFAWPLTVFDPWFPPSPPPPPPAVEPSGTTGVSAQTGGASSSNQPPPIAYLTGGAGADTLDAAASANTIYGGQGDDTVSSPYGANYLRGDEGNDSISGGSDFDDINGNMGNDTAHGGSGDDWVVGGKDQDQLFGDGGGDIVYGNLGDDSCDGGAGADLVRGGQGNDTISGGGDGDDWLSGDRGDDTISGGSGADIFHTFGEAGIDRVLDFSVAQGDRVQLDPGTVWTVAQVGADTVISMTGGAQMILVGVQMSTLPSGWIFGA